jgi:hypothetical protein
MYMQVMVDLTTLSAAKEKCRLQWTEASVAKFEIPFHHLSGMTYKNPLKD